MKKLNFITGKKTIVFVSILFSIGLVVESCKKKEDEFGMVNGAAPLPNLPTLPYNYEVSGVSTNPIMTLGRVLFYDKNLSLNNGISCGSCHLQSHGFADKTRFSRGLNNELTTRNTPTFNPVDRINTGFFERTMFWDGRANNIYQAVLMPVLNHTEMNVFNLSILPEKLSNLSYYPSLFQNAFGSPDITIANIRKALSDFVGNMNATLPLLNEQRLNATELSGRNIFIGKGKCYTCHNGSDLNGYDVKYENIGLNVSYEDQGRFYVTNNTTDKGKFKVPSLRNVAVSAPYMHDGRFNTLMDVIEHYNSGIQNSPNLSPFLRNFSGANQMQLDSLNFFGDLGDLSMFPPQSLNLTDLEKKQLEAFLISLTDNQLIADPKYSNPF
jgi:cytochrome c peroxidase